ncbi:MAG: malate dehydrogenase (quinone) [Alphaproteobacteria bacterium]
MTGSGINTPSGSRTAVSAPADCDGASVAADRAVDVVLIGGGIMSATLGTLLRQLEPDWSMELFERLDSVAFESTNAWHNAGTGHSALCELNYTPVNADGDIEVERALRINEDFQISRQLWASMVRRGILSEPSSFINSTPHMSVVLDEDSIDFLQRRHDALRVHPLFAGMKFSTDHAQIERWAPLLTDGRDPDQRIAATWSPLGTDVNFGEITRQQVAALAAGPNFRLNLAAEVENLERNADGTWRVTCMGTDGREAPAVNARFVFVGAGGAALLLLQKSGIPEAKGYGGFPVGGSFIMNDNPEVTRRQRVAAYGKAAEGAPPMSVPHLDSRFIDGERKLLFGPFATFSTEFLKEGSFFDLFSSLRFSNVPAMLGVAWNQFDLVQYLVGQVRQSDEDRIKELRRFYPNADASQWRLVEAGQRVQIIKINENGGGDLEFGTELVTSEDRTLAALLGASPGASTSAAIMVDALERLFPERFASKAWQATLRDLIPSFGVRLNDDPKLLHETWAYASDHLNLAPPPEIDVAQATEARPVD